MLSFSVPGQKKVAECAQRYWMDELALSTGQCWHITNYWLCLHYILRASFKSFGDLAKREQALVDAERNNFGDVICLQEKLAFKVLYKKPVPLSGLGVKTLAEIKDESAFYPAAKVPVTTTGKKDASQFASALKQAMSGSPTACFNFSYWMEKENGAAAHSVGIIKNPNAECAVLFFDCNYGVWAFKDEKTFDAFALDYFTKELSGYIPVSTQAFFLKGPKLESIPKPDVKPLLVGVIAPAEAKLTSIKIHVPVVVAKPSTPPPITNILITVKA